MKADEPVAELETDKVSMEVNAPVAGVLSERLVAEGDTVEVGALIGKIDKDAKAQSSAVPAPKAADSAKDSGASSSADNAELVDVVVPEAGNR